jgi:hypothetical protein
MMTNYKLGKLTIADEHVLACTECLKEIVP